jgi:hypothetical protein
MVFAVASLGAASAQRSSAPDIATCEALATVAAQRACAISAFIELQRAAQSPGSQPGLPLSFDDPRLLADLEA